MNTLTSNQKEQLYTIAKEIVKDKTNFTNFQLHSLSHKVGSKVTFMVDKMMIVRVLQEKFILVHLENDFDYVTFLIKQYRNNHLTLQEMENEILNLNPYEKSEIEHNWFFEDIKSRFEQIKNDPVGNAYQLSLSSSGSIVQYFNSENQEYENA